MKQMKKKYLLANRRQDRTFVPLEKVPVYLQSELIPHAKYYTDIDENGIILDQQLVFREFQIYYHLIHLSEDTRLTTVLSDKDYVPASLNGLQEYNPAFPLKLKLPTEGKLVNLFPEREFVMHFHVNFDSIYLHEMIKRNPLFQVLNPKAAIDSNETQEFTPPRHPYRATLVNYLLMQRIINCKLVGERAEHYLHRKAYEYFLTYLHYLETPAPIMLHESYTAKLNEIARYIIQNPVAAHSKETLCRKFDVVPEFLDEPFRATFYITVEELIHQERMDQLFRLLTEQQHTLTYVANRTGFANYKAMKIAFQQHYQCLFDFFLNLQ
jgi:AraC-like DNA-binding protein